uniref:AlNc14C346G10860 protein n=1 Tax=Albugo laibachii Nc14 TaxID=890382 RepID=F0WXA7_9STRA|nr:AlNc14C346G10860 [Albugo laibachii Nc14]|eukprot:CCA26099.1 AlNc14C346G10860 [Albugo laibachii Nc14]
MVRDTYNQHIFLGRPYSIPWPFTPTIQSRNIQAMTRPSKRMKRMQHLTVLSAQKRKKMLIEHDSIVKCTDVNNHREEDSGNNDNTGTTNEDNNDSWNKNNSDSSDIGSGYETNDDDDEKIPPGQHAILANQNAPKDEENSAFKRAVVGTKPLTAYIIKLMAENEQEGEEDSQRDDSAESSDSNNNTSNWTDAKLSASIEKLKAMKVK